MTHRYTVHLSFGYLNPSAGSVNRPPGVTATVHDTHYLHQTVGLFRSEDFHHGVGVRGQRTVEQMCVAAIAAAVTLAGKLNWAPT